MLFLETDCNPHDASPEVFLSERNTTLQYCHFREALLLLDCLREGQIRQANIYIAASKTKTDCCDFDEITLRTH